MNNLQAKKAYETGLEGNRLPEDQQPDEEIRGRIIRFLERFEEVDDRTLQLNVPFWVQALKRNIETQLYLDRVEVDTGLISVDDTPNEVLAKALGGLLNNYDEIEQYFIDQRDRIKEILNTGNLVIVTNHSTWMNFPVILHMLIEVVGIDREDIYTLVGPATTTREDTFEALHAMSNLIRTVPDTDNGNITDEGVANSIRARAYRECMEVLKGRGKIILMNPSGTTDKTSPAGKIGLDEPSHGSWKLVDNLANPKRAENPTVMCLGTNMGEMMPNNQDPQPGNAYFSFSEPKQFEDGESAQDHVRDELPKHVLNDRGQSIGEWRTES